MIKFTIIVPVYNVEKTIEKCLLSCVQQDISPSDYEVIIIDDGTKDKSMHIVERIAKTQQNVRVISQKNQGLSIVRNNGISLAKGEYIMLLDSDDWIERNSLKGVLKKLDENADVFAMGYYLKYEMHNHIKIIDYDNKTIQTGFDLVKYGYFGPSQFYIYKKSFLLENQLNFFPGIFCQDTEFTIRALIKADRIGFLNNPIYYFYRNKDSVTLSANPKRCYDLIIAANSLSKFSAQETADIKNLVNNRIAKNIKEALNSSLRLENEEQTKFLRFLVNNKSLFNHMIRSTIKENIYLGYFLKFSPIFNMTIYSWIRMLFADKDRIKIM